MAMVGRPNVGKSALFNRLLRNNNAIVHNRPGVTRDWQEGDFDGISLVDTAGLVRLPQDPLEQNMTDGTRRLMDQSQLLIFVVDAQQALQDDDWFAIETMRKTGLPTWLVVNKCDHDRVPFDHIYALGMEPLKVSAAHGLGVHALATRIHKHFDVPRKKAILKSEEQEPVRFSIIGRPNVGKSTLANGLVRSARLIVSDVPGTTRDAVALDCLHNGQRMVLTDTAGIRRKAHHGDLLEKTCVQDAYEAFNFSHVAVLVMDATEPFGHQELTLAGQAEAEGRGLVVVLNKWDAVVDRQKTQEELKRVFENMPVLRHAPRMTLSAKTMRHGSHLLDAVCSVYKEWTRRLGTGVLNRWIQETVGRNPPPNVLGRPVRIKYATQVSARPPHFVLSGNRLDSIPESYVRFLQNELRDSFGFDGTPIRITLRTEHNPYV